MVECGCRVVSSQMASVRCCSGYSQYSAAYKVHKHRAQRAASLAQDLEKYSAAYKVKAQYSPMPRLASEAFLLQVHHVVQVHHAYVKLTSAQQGQTLWRGH